ncbi:unnamed protein product [Prorocentrum cordatum]|uniref:Prolyl 4-hydroxylase alpha subunit domain-containing protein n=1 Tax=Prorocentrum cordatum TaxID=2364126 RepID=A0ABN9TFY5_9DINO|nr:unnamed protein product [Polarella glacialis]
MLTMPNFNVPTCRVRRQLGSCLLIGSRCSIALLASGWPSGAVASACRHGGGHGRGTPRQSAAASAGADAPGPMVFAVEAAAWDRCSARHGWEPRHATPPGAGAEGHRQAQCSACSRGAAAEAGLCCGCLLLREARGCPFDALDAPAARWLRLADLCSTWPATGSPPSGPSVQPAAPDGPGPGYLSFSGPVVVFWDGRDAAAKRFVDTLRRAFPGLCLLIDAREHRCREEALTRFPGVPRDQVCRKGGVTGVLPPGVFVPNCETHPQILLYELKYRRSVQPPPPEVVISYERHFMCPLAQVRREHQASGNPSHWFLRDDALRLVARSMAQHRFCILDGFLPDNDARDLEQSLRGFRTEGLLTPGTEYYKLRAKQGAKADMPDLLSSPTQPRKWNMRTESLIYCDDGDPRAPVLGRLGAATDGLVAALRRGGPDGDYECRRRLQHALFREPHLCACYPGECRGRHARHIDNDSPWLHRTLTAIIYLNSGWGREHGGEFRLFDRGRSGTQVAFDVLPVANRMVLFWATEDCPHEVLHCNQDRFAISLIYVDGRASILNPDSQARLRVLHELIPTRPYCREEALRQCTRTSQEAQALIAQARVVGAAVAAEVR